ncbi:predicted protein [Chaetoceros tenuissimus]|uniref:Uncharacterized protein n=1 Tax=Chaetoceros tenuissimus TaxID=426638 RepID=A0AAD3CSB5_9STRA|nr:predicted protein [Chaetoceros tenuissimus]
MRAQTEEWRRFIPGVRMYKGKKTLFYNGEILWEGEVYPGRPLIYDEEERESWEVVIVLPGVEEIPGSTFEYCINFETVILRNTMFSTDATDSNLFDFPEIWNSSEYVHFMSLGDNVIASTALIRASTFEINERGVYDSSINENVNEWVKNVNQGKEYELHRACSSFNPIIDIIYGIVRRKGIGTFQKKNELGMTPFDYLEANPFIELHIDQKVLMKRYVLEMMGEAVFNIL